MQSVGSTMFHATFVALLLAGGLSVGCVSDEDPDGKGDAGSGGGGSGATGGSAGSGTSGGAAGGSASGGGGAGGTGGMPAAMISCAMTAEASGTSPLLTDFEALSAADGTFTFESAGLLGGSYIYSDLMAVDEPSTTERSLSEGHDETSKQALVGKIHNATWGGGLGLWFACIDASVYTGITFWARGSSPAGEVKVLLSVNAAEVAAKGGDCPDAGPCDRPFTTFELTDEWTEYTFEWADFTEGNAAGTPVPASPVDLYGLEFSLPNDNMSRDLELALDDVSFTTE